MIASISHVGRLRDPDSGLFLVLTDVRYCYLDRYVLNKRSGEHLHSPTAASTRERSIARRWISVERIAGKRDCKKKSNFCIIVPIILIVIHSPETVPYSHASKRWDSCEQVVTVVSKWGVVRSQISSRCPVDNWRYSRRYFRATVKSAERRVSVGAYQELWKCCLK